MTMPERCTPLLLDEVDVAFVNAYRICDTDYSTKDLEHASYWFDKGFYFDLAKVPADVNFDESKLITACFWYSLIFSSPSYEPVWFDLARLWFHFGFKAKE